MTAPSALHRTTLAAVLTAVTASAQTAPQPAPTLAPAPVTIPAHSGYAHPDPERDRRQDDGSVTRCEGELVFYLHLATPGALELQLTRTANAPAAALLATVAPHPATPTGKPTTTNTSTANATAAAEQTAIPFPAFTIPTPGWHTLTLRNADGTPLRALHHLTLTGAATAGLHTNTIERRNAASVHLGYPVPKEHRDDIEWLYVELTPKTDPLWTYYMATGWHRGYFGMQVNSPTERRLIFSVWDAGNEAVDRNKVADTNRVTLIQKGEGVVADSFGNEGTGGHSHLVHDWRLGDTFRFLLHARKDGDGTVYSGWFWFAERKQWGLIASFRAPKDGKLLHGLYSFSENFHGANGDAVRECEFGNVHARTAGGQWLPVLRARFTHDETGERARPDRWAGVHGDRFFLRHGGFTEAPKDAARRGGDAIDVPRSAGQPPSDAELPQPPR